MIAKVTHSERKANSPVAKLRASAGLAPKASENAAQTKYAAGANNTAATHGLAQGLRSAERTRMDGDRPLNEAVPCQ